VPNRKKRRGKAYCKKWEEKEKKDSARGIKKRMKAL